MKTNRYLLKLTKNDNLPVDDDPGSKKLYLSEWCVDLDEAIDAPIDSLFKDFDDLKEHSDQLLKTFQKIKKNLPIKMNFFYGTSFSASYWGIILDAFFLHWLSSAFLKYISLSKILADFPGEYLISSDVRTNTLPQKSSVLDIMKELSGDETNLALIRDIISQMNESGKFKKFYEQDNQVATVLKKDKTLMQVLKAKLNVQFSRIGDHYFGEIIGIKPIEKLKLKIQKLPVEFTMLCQELFSPKKWGAIQPVKPLENFFNVPLIENAENEFENIINKIFPYYFPKLYLSGIPKQPVLKRVKRWVGLDVYLDIHNIFFIARIVENNGEWFCNQHGGVYGQAAIHPLTEIEVRLSDKFLSWGEELSKIYGTKSIPIFSPYLQKLPKYVYAQQNKVLFVETGGSLFDVRLQSYLQPIKRSEYKKLQNLFFNHLSKKIVANSVFKRYPSGFGDNQLPGNLRETSEKPCAYIKQCVLCVLDHCGTTLLEMLYMNVPIICYWDETSFKESEFSAPYFDGFRKIGILHKDPISAAKFINELGDNISKWWLSSEIQEERQKFLKGWALKKDLNEQKSWLQLVYNLPRQQK